MVMRAGLPYLHVREAMATSGPPGALSTGFLAPDRALAVLSEADTPGLLAPDRALHVFAETIPTNRYRYKDLYALTDPLIKQTKTATINAKHIGMKLGKLYNIKPPIGLT